MEWHQLEDLVSPTGGLISATQRLSQSWGDPRIKAYSAYAGDATYLIHDGIPTYRLRYSGAGRSQEEAHARKVAIIEAVERYSTCIFQNSEIIEASAISLGKEALDLGSVAQPSSFELADPRCPLALADKKAPIRWVKGLELVEGRQVWLPAVMVFMGLRPQQGEQFWLQISTGCAAHTDVRTALALGLMEVVERDSVSLLWLQRLPLPPVNPANLDDKVQEVINWCRWRGVDTQLFDATTDLGIPTVYVLQLAPADQRAAQLVGCATAPTFNEAAYKAVTETSMARTAVHSAQKPPHEIFDFHRVLDGAALLGRSENRGAFSFLLNGRESRLPSSKSDLKIKGADLLGTLLDIFANLALPVYAADLTTREAAAAGLCVVRVIVPALQPLSFRPPAQYRGHRRLYEGPRAMGYRSYEEAHLNPWPQPFP